VVPCVDYGAFSLDVKSMFDEKSKCLAS
jgi:hypothetical protein